MLNRTLIGWMHQLRAIEALLTLALLHEEVVPAVAIESKFATTSAINTLFCAAVGLQFWHRAKGF